MSERPGFAVSKAESKLQDATIKIIQPEEQFPHWQRLGEDILQLIPGVQTLQSGAIHELQRPWPLM